MPTDPPTLWALLAAARRETFSGPAPSGAVQTAAKPAETSHPFLSAIATAVFRVFDSAFLAVAGPPVLPPGSTVTVESSTLQYGNGYVAPADWYFPADPNPKGLIYFQHGFLALAPIYSYTAAALAEQTHSIVVAPTITSNFLAADGNWLGGTTMPAAAADLFLGDRPALNTSAWAAAGHPVTLPQTVVLVGHSLGGNFVLSTARDMADNLTIGSLAGVVLLDGVAFQPGLVASTVAKVPTDLQILDISSEPYFWNEYGQMETDLAAERPGQFNGVQLVGGRHIDALQGGKPLIQFAEYLVAGFSKPQNVEAVKILATGWINDMLAGNRIVTPPDQPFEIPTTAGTATAYSIPPPPTELTLSQKVLKKIELFGVSALFNLDSAPAATSLPSPLAAVVNL
ncbi:MAG TPA: hypothetical protein VH496_11285 [Mycobacterium sp.]